MLISRPRTPRISALFGASLARSTTAPSRWCSRISPPTMRPGAPEQLQDRPGGDRLAAAGLADDAQGPVAAKHEVEPVDRLHHALAGEEMGLAGPRISSRMSAIAAPQTVRIGIGRVAQAVAEEVEGEHGDDHGEAREQQPGRGRHRVDVLRLLQQHAPGDDGRLQADAEEGQRRLGQDHFRDRQRRHRDDVRGEGRHQLARDDLELRDAVEPGGDDEILVLRAP